MQIDNSQKSNEFSLKFMNLLGKCKCRMICTRERTDKLIANECSSDLYMYGFAGNGDDNGGEVLDGHEGDCCAIIAMCGILFA